MAKFNQGNLVLSATQEIIQGSTTILDANGVAYLSSLDVSAHTELETLDVNDLTTLDTLTFALGGAVISEISTDGTLAGDSDAAVPTEQAVKTYVDTQVGILPHNDLEDLQGGDSTSLDYYHLTKAIHDSLYSDSPLIGIGSQTGTNIEVDYGADTIVASINNNDVMNLQETTQRFGGTNSYFLCDQTSNNVSIPDGYDSIASFGDNNQSVGKNSTVNTIWESSAITLSDNTSTLAVFKIDSVELYHNGSKVAETTSNGITGAVWG